MDSLQSFLTAQVQACRTLAAALTADDRIDEAVFEKIRANVYGIFLSVLAAARNQPEPMAFFRQNLDSIPSAWEHALEKARAHGDEERAHTETVKLEVVAVIQARLEVTT